MRFLKNIGIISRCTDMYRDDRFKELGINSRQAVYLQHICREPGITQDALGKNICVNKSNVTRQISLLEENGYTDLPFSAVDLLRYWDKGPVYSRKKRK